VALSLFAGATPVRAQSAALDADRLTHRLMSPYCAGLLLADCRSQGAVDLRAEILQRLESGERPDAIERDLIARFGSAIRTEPAFSGLGVVVWLGPLALGLAGIGLIGSLLRRATHRIRTPDGSEHDGVERDAGDVRMHLRLQDELDALD
jgi:cytochrome c-type biogenesis protein CcmH/NrfF